MKHPSSKGLPRTLWQFNSLLWKIVHVQMIYLLFHGDFLHRLFTLQGLPPPRKEKGKTVQQFREAVKFMKGRDEQEQMEDRVRGF